MVAKIKIKQDSCSGERNGIACPCKKTEASVAAGGVAKSSLDHHPCQTKVAAEEKPVADIAADEVHDTGPVNVLVDLDPYASFRHTVASAVYNEPYGGPVLVDGEVKSKKIKFNACTAYSGNIFNSVHQFLQILWIGNTSPSQAPIGVPGLVFCPQIGFGNKFIITRTSKCFLLGNRVRQSCKPNDQHCQEDFHSEPLWFLWCGHCAIQYLYTCCASVTFK